MSNYLSSLPSEIIAHIAIFTNSKTKREFSMVDVRINGVVLDQTKSLAILPPNFSCPYGLSKMPDNILVNIIQRYPNLKKLIFGSNNFKEFQSKEVPYLEKLIHHLQQDNKLHLSSLKKIEYSEIPADLFGTLNKALAKKLNTLFLSTMGHNRLEKIKIKAYHNGSLLTEMEIQPTLINSPNLTTFIFSGSDQNTHFSFAESPHLRKVKLLHWKGSFSTIESLRSCKKLKKLILDYQGFSDNEIKVVLSIDHSWNLNRLELKGITLSSDNELNAITKKFPNLECLKVNLQNISDEGMRKLGENCPHLKILNFNNKDVTNVGLDNLTKHLPNLELISFDQAYQITEEGIAAIARNCKKLRFIHVIHHKRIEKSGIEALSQHCPDLKAVGFSHGGPVSLDGLYEFISQRPQLRYLELRSLDNIENEQLDDIYLKYPLIRRKIPYTSNAKQMHNLTN